MGKRESVPVTVGRERAFTPVLDPTPRAFTPVLRISCVLSLPRLGVNVRISNGISTGKDLMI